MNERELINILLKYTDAPSKDLVTSEFCYNLCPDKKDNKLNLSCRFLVGGNPCQEAEEFYQRYELTKSRSEEVARV